MKVSSLKMFLSYLGQTHAQQQAGSSFASSESPWPTFGLGKHRRAKVTVTWPSGLIETYPENPANSLITLIEETGNHKHKKHEDRDED